MRTFSDRYVYVEFHSDSEVRLQLKLEVCKTSFERARGLMFRPNIVNLLFVFEREEVYPIHSFFVFGEFDAVYVGSDLHITEIYPRIKPWSFIYPKKKSSYLIELKSGLSEASGLTEGMLVRFL